MADPVGLLLKNIPFRSKSTFYYDFWAGIFYGLFAGLTEPFIGMIARKLHASNFLMALLVAAPMVGLLFTLLLDPFLQERKKMGFVVWPGILGRACYFSMFFIVSPAAFVAVYCAFGIVNSQMMPSFAGIMRSNYPDERLRGMLIAKVRMGITLVSMAAAFLGGWALSLHERNYQIIFPLAALFGIVSTLIFRQIRVRGEKHIGRAPREKKTLASFFQAFKIFRKDPRYLRYSVAFFVAGFGTTMLAPLFPIYWADDLHLSLFQAGWLGALLSLCVFFSYWAWGFFLKRSHPVRCLSWLFLLNCVLPLLYILSLTVLRRGAPGPVFQLVIAAQLLMGFINAGWDLLWLVGVISFGNREKSAQYAALQTALLGLRGLIAPFAGIWLLGILGKQPVWALSAGLMLLGSWLMLRESRQRSLDPL